MGEVPETTWSGTGRARTHHPPSFVLCVFVSRVIPFWDALCICFSVRVIFENNCSLFYGFYHGTSTTFGMLMLIMMMMMMTMTMTMTMMTMMMMMMMLLMMMMMLIND